MGHIGWEAVREVERLPHPPLATHTVPAMHLALVRDFVAATITGWQNYLADPTKGNAAILAANQHGMTAEALQFGSTELVPLAVPEPMQVAELGKMEPDRWQTLITQMEQVQLLKPGAVKAEDCYTREFLPKIAADADAAAGATR